MDFRLPQSPRSRRRAALSADAVARPAPQDSTQATVPPPATRLLLRSTRLALAGAGLGVSTQAGTTVVTARAQARQVMEALMSGVPSATSRQPAAPLAWSAAHLSGFLDAAQERCLAVPSQEPVVVMASAGGPRQLPVLTPLLALWLAREGVRVVLHGPLDDSTGITSAEVLRGLGLAPVTQAADVVQAWSRREPAFMATTTLCPALAPLLQREQGAAWRSVARRLARLLDPIVGAPSLRVVHHGSHDTHQLLARWAELDRVAVMLLRGADGEPVADLRRRPRIDTWLGGLRQKAHSCAAQSKDPAAPPLWPHGADAAATALYAQAVLSGERPSPAPLATQVALILGLMPALQRLIPGR
jgi:anthranilate phosphoribosyltransferase